METDDDRDDEPSRPLLPPDDRLWRHPSEVVAHGLPARARAAMRGPNESRLWLVAGLTAAISALLTSGVVAVAGGFGDKTEVRTVTVPAVERVALPAPAAAGTSSAPAPGTPVIDIAERLRPSIVQIEVEGGEGRGRGSGVIFRSDGHVLTNHHLVDGARRLTVVTADGAEEEGQLIGSDAETDVAVIKINRSGLTGAAMGTASNLKVGQVAVAIGSPLGLAGGPSVSVGVVSALGRQIKGPNDVDLLDMIQTDAPIAPGASGGALVDGSGAVIGLTTAIPVSEVGAEGLGFATPIDIARDVASQLITTGKVVHVWLGIEGEDLGASVAKGLGLEGGALVRRVQEDSPAASAGVKSRDVITSMNGTPVRSMGALKVALRALKPGDVVSLMVSREGKPKPVQVTLAQRPG